jgi:hypothetical protein
MTLLAMVSARKNGASWMIGMTVSEYLRMLRKRNRVLPDIERCNTIR